MIRIHPLSCDRDLQNGWSSPVRESYRHLIQVAVNLGLQSQHRGGIGIACVHLSRTSPYFLGGKCLSSCFSCQFCLVCLVLNLLIPSNPQVSINEGLYIYIYTYKYMYMHTYIYIHIYGYIWIYIHIYGYIWIYIWILYFTLVFDLSSEGKHLLASPWPSFRLRQWEEMHRNAWCLLTPSNAFSWSFKNFGTFFSQPFSRLGQALPSTDTLKQQLHSICKVESIIECSMLDAFCRLMSWHCMPLICWPWASKLVICPHAITVNAFCWLKGKQRLIL